MKKYEKWIVAAVMFLTFMAMYLCVYRHVLIFHEQHHLFRFSWSYLSELIHQKGIVEPAVEFMAQFGYWPWLGAAIWSALLVGVYLMTRSIIKQLSGLTDYLQLSAILPCWMFFNSVEIDKTLTAPCAAFLIVFGIWILALIFGRFIPKKKFRQWNSPLQFITGPVIFLSIFFGFYYQSFKAIDVVINNKERHFTREQVKNQKYNEKLMIKADQAMRRKDWDEVIALAEQQAATGTKNHLMAYFRSMALFHKGQLLDSIFELPQYFGPRTLFFPWKPDKNQAEYGGYVYEQLGALNSATHWEFEALVGWGETSQHLINLSRYYIKAGKPEQAKKFIAPLHQTLFYRSTAKQLDRYLAQGDVDDLKSSLPIGEQKEFRADNVLNIADDCKYLLMFDPSNEMARQYMMLTLLLANNLGSFYSNLQQYYVGRSLPRLFQEALCLVRLNYGSERLAADGFTISPEVDMAFRSFLAEKDKGKFTRFTPAQKATYWYYVTKLSPEGPNLNF
ncbi:MAG: DUF6057 family protein [Bacteroides sp.]|nr:DUF6057 family protein [Bacteroides sp.]MCM1379084.1 DUF6057 family protein [Bacteroides sp.]MCM1445782.1 DUF6057 family protein [Prevotella sp.]